MTVFIGIDGGGSACRVAIADAEGRVLGDGAGGPANATTDFAEAVRNALAALDVARQAAGLGTADIQRATAHAGLAGIMNADDATRFAAEMPMKTVTVTDDRMTNVVGALGARDGLVLAIGTGSFVAGRQGQDVRFIGGWGLRVGDQASGAWLGRALLEHVLLAHDGMAEASPLTDGVLAGFGNDPNGLVGFATNAAPQDFAEFAPRIAASAEEGDAVAATLMTGGAAYLDKAIARLDPGPHTVICLTGGLGPHYARWLNRAYRDRLAPKEGTALDGALGLARQQRDGTV